MNRGHTLFYNAVIASLVLVLLLTLVVSGVVIVRGCADAPNAKVGAKVTRDPGFFVMSGELVPPESPKGVRIGPDSVATGGDVLVTENGGRALLGSDGTDFFTCRAAKEEKYVFFDEECHTVLEIRAQLDGGIMVRARQDAGVELIYMERTE